MDNAATTRVTEPVLEAMLPLLTGTFGNPSSQHAFGREAAAILSRARRSAAAFLNAQPGEVYFTSGGTEADNWAVKGAAQALRARHVIVSAMEHHAVLGPCAQLEAQGVRVTYLRPDEGGRIAPESLERALAADTALVSVMAANNEVGTVQPVRALCEIAHAHGALFHTDAVQAAGWMPLDVRALGADMLSLSGHKLHAPKGVGLLYVRQGTALAPLIAGGEQEKGKRGGTENIAAIAGMARALEWAAETLARRAQQVRALRDRLREGLLALPGAHENGDAQCRLPGMLNVGFEGMDGALLSTRLDMRGVAVSTGSACMAGSPEPSHVLRAMGQSEAQAKQAVRFSLSEENTDAEVDEVIRLVQACLALR